MKKIILTTLLCFFILIPSFTFDELSFKDIIYTLMPSVENIKIENSTIYIYEKEDTAINDINYSLAFLYESISFYINDYNQDLDDIENIVYIANNEKIIIHKDEIINYIIAGQRGLKNEMIQSKTR